MSEKWTIVADGQPQEIEARPMTLLFHAGGVNLQVPEAVTLDPEVTLYHGERVQKLHPRTLELLAIVEKTSPLARGSMAYKHVIGLLDLTLKLSDMGRRVFWKYPESFLHPCQAVELGDVMIMLSLNQ